MVSVIYTKYSLSEGEHKRHKESILGRILLRYGLEKYCKLIFENEEWESKIAVHTHGKPYLKDYPYIHFNISHCDSLIVCALSDRNIGIDVERIDEFPDSIIKKILTKREQEILNKYKGAQEEYKKMFYRFWTKKESYLKWAGEGFYMNPLDVEFSMDESSSFLYCSDKRVELFETMLDTSCILNICLTQGEKEDIIYELYEEEMVGFGSKLFD